MSIFHVDGKNGSETGVKESAENYEKIDAPGRVRLVQRKSVHPAIQVLLSRWDFFGICGKKIRRNLNFFELLL